MKKIDISIILTFHNEGIVIHKTFLALKRMLTRLHENNVKYEILAHIDNGDADTLEYIEKVEKDFNLKVFSNSFGNPSESRNYAINQAQGKYVCLMDGDDLFSENWLFDSYRLLEDADEEIILHPEFNISFGLNEQTRVWRMKNSFDLSEDMLILLGRNRWCSGTFLRRDVALKNLYKKATGCYGYEDWWYNCETRFRGVKHNVTPNSVVFYRIREGSTYHLHTEKNTTVPYCEAFSFKNVEKIYTTNPIEFATIEQPTNNELLHILRIGHKVLRHTPILRRADYRIMKKVESRRARMIYDSLPSPVINEWKKINTIDGTTYPDPEIVARMSFYESEVDGYGKAFYTIMHKLQKSPDYVFMMPVMGIGGTEKVLENYLQSITQNHPDWHILVLGKLPDGHPYDIPENVIFIDFSCEAYKCNDWDLDFLLTRLIVQAKIKRIHIVNNEFYYRWAISNKNLLKTNNIIVNISFFMHEYTKDKNRIQSFADPYLIELAPCINRIFTDNATIVEDLENREGIASDKFSVHYQPVSLPMNKPKKLINKKTHKILWASRITPQKRPDILKAISKRVPEGYSIDAYGRIEKACYKNSYFNDCKNICYKGAFSDISKLPIDEYDAYLYTSQTDGIPNILLEISTLGLPIVATKEGGVPDFIEDGVSGRLVDIDDIDGYVGALVDIIDSKKSVDFVKRAQEKIQERHTWEQYVQKVKKDI